MNVKAKFLELPIRHALEVKSEVPMLKIPNTLGNGFTRIKKHAESVEAEISGAPYARYLDMNWESIRSAGLAAQIWQLLTHRQKLRVGIPTKETTIGNGEIESVEIPPVRCVHGVHNGALHKITNTYKQMLDWAADENIDLVDYAIESYETDPNDVSSDDQLETAIYIPVNE